MRRGAFHGIIELVQDLRVSDWIAQLAQPAIKDLLLSQPTGERIKEGVHGDWLGHPLHSAITDLPIGAWTSAALFDALGGDAESWNARAADACIIAGIVTALPTALAGVIDWSETKGRAARTGVAHATCNVLALGLYISSLIARKNDRRRGKLLAYAGWGVLLLGGTLGGHLVFAHGVGVEPDVTEQPNAKRGEIAVDKPVIASF